MVRFHINNAYEDPRFGWYDEKWARQFDNIVYQYQSYLPVIAAGNEQEKTEDVGDGRRPEDHPNPAFTGKHVEFADANDVFGTLEDSFDAQSNPTRSFFDGTVNADGTPNPEGYDTLQPYAVMKNALVVTSIHDLPLGPESVLANPPAIPQLWSGQPQDLAAPFGIYASIGPPDDGRVKPDLAAAGTNGKGADSAGIDLYATGSGTSPAAAGVTGILQIVREMLDYFYFSFQNGGFARDEGSTAWLSSTKRALLIHTALDVGNPGPDYKFGWGIPYPIAIHDLLLADSLSIPLAGNQQFSTTPHVKEFRFQQTQGDPLLLDHDVTATGAVPLVVTLAWTDPQGPIFPPDLDNHANIALVNDLDLRVYPPGSTTPLMPWKLDPANPSAFSTKGDNIVDNVERIEIDSPVPGGIYRIEITHKGDLTDGNSNPAAQTASLLISGNDPIQQNPELRIEIEPMGQDQYALTFPTHVGGVYRVEGTDTLTPTNFGYDPADPASGPLGWYTVVGDGSLSVGAAPVVENLLPDPPTAIGVTNRLPSIAHASTLTPSLPLTTVIVTPPAGAQQFYYRVRRIR